jgi:cytosine/uracil/thiamine/allantoin permease
MRLNQKNLTLLVIFCFSFLALTVNAGSNTDSCEDVDENAPNAAWINDGGYIIVIWGVCVMFWGLALVCEEFFVPALHVLCEEWQIPDGKIKLLYYIYQKLYSN